MVELVLPDGAVYKADGDGISAVKKDKDTNGGNKETMTTWAQVIKEQHAKAAALDAAADQWEKRAHEGTYTLAKEVRDYLRDKARNARAEAAKLRGEAVDGR